MGYRTELKGAVKEARMLIDNGLKGEEISPFDYRNIALQLALNVNAALDAGGQAYVQDNALRTAGEYLMLGKVHPSMHIADIPVPLSGAALRAQRDVSRPASFWETVVKTGYALHSLDHGHPVDAAIVCFDFGLTDVFPARDEKPEKSYNARVYSKGGDFIAPVRTMDVTHVSPAVPIPAVLGKMGFVAGPLIDVHEYHLTNIPRYMTKEPGELAQLKHIWKPKKVSSGEVVHLPELSQDVLYFMAKDAEALTFALNMSRA